MSLQPNNIRAKLTKMTSAEVVETLVIVNNNSYFLNYNVDLLYRPKEENNQKLSFEKGQLHNRCKEITDSLANLL